MGQAGWGEDEVEVRTERGRMEGKRVSGCRKERGTVEGEVGDCGSNLKPYIKNSKTMEDRPFFGFTHFPILE